MKEQLSSDLEDCFPVAPKALVRLDRVTDSAFFILKLVSLGLVLLFIEKLCCQITFSASPSVHLNHLCVTFGALLPLHLMSLSHIIFKNIAHVGSFSYFVFAFVHQWIVRVMSFQNLRCHACDKWADGRTESSAVFWHSRKKAGSQDLGSRTFFSQNQEFLSKLGNFRQNSS